jgi:chloramphenicol 3-O phosphotransferase
MTDGQIVILNGPSRSGKSSIVAAMQSRADGVWMNIGMDHHIAATPPAYRPGVGLRPQRLDPSHQDDGRVSLRELEDVLPDLYAGLYGSIAAHAREGLNVISDGYQHDYYTQPLGILPRCAALLEGMPVLFVGVHCPVDVIWERRKQTWGQVRDAVDDKTREAVELGQQAARSHRYDLAFDTSELTPEQCAEAIIARIREQPYGDALAAAAAGT